MSAACFLSRPSGWSVRGCERGRRWLRSRLREVRACPFKYRWLGYLPHIGVLGDVMQSQVKKRRARNGFARLYLSSYEEQYDSVCAGWLFVDEWACRFRLCSESRSKNGCAF